MRRLPVFFMLDCSESMIGDNLKKMEDGFQAIIHTLRTDPHALETVYISVIAFAGVARTIAPLVEVVSFYPPKLPVGGGTSLGAALRTLMAELDTSIIKTTADRKGDWKPIIYLLTDGKPTDEVEPAIADWNARYVRKATLIAIALGRYADLQVLQRLTKDVLIFEESGEGDFKKFVDWVSASVVAQSKSMGEAEAGSNLLLDDSVLKIVKNPPLIGVDLDCVTLVGRCQKTHKPYLIKYERSSEAADRHYGISGCYPIDEDFFTWSDPATTDLKVNIQELIGVPGCPHCSNSCAITLCGCGKLFCCKGYPNEETTCPWCQTTANIMQNSDFEVGRGKG